MASLGCCKVTDQDIRRAHTICNEASRERETLTRAGEDEDGEDPFMCIKKRGDGKVRHAIEHATLVGQ